MQATGTFSGSGNSKRASAIVAALMAAFLLGGAGIFVAKATIGQANPHVNAAPAVVPQSVIGSDSYRAVRGGLQLGDAAAPAVQSSLGACTYANLYANHYESCGSAITSGPATVSSSSSAAGDACIWVNRRKAC